MRCCPSSREPPLPRFLPGGSSQGGFPALGGHQVLLETLGQACWLLQCSVGKPEAHGVLVKLPEVSVLTLHLDVMATSRVERQR